MGQSPTPYVIPSPQTGGRKVPISNFSQRVGCCRKCQSKGVEHILRYIGWLVKWCHEQLYSFRQKPQLSERRSSTICVVVERPDHHWGDEHIFSYLAGSVGISTVRPPVRPDDNCRPRSFCVSSGKNHTSLEIFADKLHVFQRALLTDHKIWCPNAPFCQTSNLFS